MPDCESAVSNSAVSSYLLLEDGSVFSGQHFGAEISADGEVGKRFFVRLEHVQICTNLWTAGYVHVAVTRRARARRAVAPL